jgi:biopolymer transport protein ExbB
MNPLNQSYVLSLARSFRLRVWAFSAAGCLPCAGLTAAEQGSQKLSLWGMIEQGGWAMYPLGLCSLIMFYLMIHVWNETRAKRFLTPGTVAFCEPLIRQRQMGALRTHLLGQPCVFARVFEKSLLRIRLTEQDLNLPKAESALLDHLEAEDQQIGQWVHYLNVVAAVAPMIGLLGTVSGMISAFQTIGQGGMGKPELLANDIGEALITTAAGLIVGIPAMVSYFVLRNRLSHAVQVVGQSAGDLLDQIPKGQGDVGLDGAKGGELIS